MTTCETALAHLVDVIAECRMKEWDKGQARPQIVANIPTRRERYRQSSTFLAKAILASLSDGAVREVAAAQLLQHSTDGLTIPVRHLDIEDWYDQFLPYEYHRLLPVDSPLLAAVDIHHVWAFYDGDVRFIVPGMPSIRKGTGYLLTARPWNDPRIEVDVPEDDLFQMIE